MVVPYDARNTSKGPSSMASQTILADSSDEYGQSWTSKKGAKDKKQRPRLPKIKSSPSNGALAEARSKHEKGHRRGNSLSEAQTSPTFLPDYLMQTSGSAFPGSAHVASYAVPPLPDSKTAKSKVKLKPLLRNFTSKEQMTIDLSRSAAENEGLNMYANSEAAMPVRTPSGSIRQGYHVRTTSGLSQVSATTTSSNRFGNPYMHPMRQNPLPYSPPLAGSYQTSSLDPEQNIYDEDIDPAIYTLPPPSRRNISSAMHNRNGSSFTNSSQTNLPGTPSSLRFPADMTPETLMSPLTARSSLDSAFRKRSRSNTAQTDPTQQAATVQQLRKQFQEKEAAKERKYREAEQRAEEKERRRQDKKEEDERRSMDRRTRRRARSNAASEKSSSSFAGLGLALSGTNTNTGGRSEHEISPPLNLVPTLHKKHNASPRAPPLSLGYEGQRSGADAMLPPQSQANRDGNVHRASQWTLFWVRVRTMWFRFKRKMSGGGTNSNHTERRDPKPKQKKEKATMNEKLG